ncbi:MAG: RNase H family protein, partial [Sphingomicrobium sp.]
MTSLPLVELFTDGACRGNPGPGGWAVLLRMGEKEREIAGGESHTYQIQLTAGQ